MTQKIFDIYCLKMLHTFVKPGLRMVITIAENVCDYVPKRIFKLSRYRLQIFLVKDQDLFLQSLQIYGD